MIQWEVLSFHLFPKCTPWLSTNLQQQKIFQSCFKQLALCMQRRDYVVLLLSIAVCITSPISALVEKLHRNGIFFMTSQLQMYCTLPDCDYGLHALQMDHKEACRLARARTDLTGKFECCCWIAVRLQFPCCVFFFMSMDDPTLRAITVQSSCHVLSSVSSGVNCVSVCYGRRECVSGLSL